MEPTSPGSVNQSPASAAQAHVRARYAATLSAWRQLSAEERAAHNAAAEPLRISGWNLYLQSVMTGQMHQTDALLTEAGQIITPNTTAAIIAN